MLPNKKIKEDIATDDDKIGNNIRLVRTQKKKILEQTTMRRSKPNKTIKTARLCDNNTVPYSTKNNIKKTNNNKLENVESNSDDGINSNDNIADTVKKSIPKSAATESSADILLCSVPLEKISNIFKTTQKQDDEITQKESKILCLYCDRSFSNQKLYLKHSQRVHLIAKDRRNSTRIINAPQSEFYGCSFCHNDKNTSFAEDLNSLFYHLVNVHSDKYFACPQCIIKFQNKELLNIHNNLEHNESSDQAKISPISHLEDNSPSTTLTTVTRTTRRTSFPKDNSQHATTTTRSSRHRRENQTFNIQNQNNKNPIFINTVEPMLSRLGIAQNRCPCNKRGGNQNISSNIIGIDSNISYNINNTISASRKNSNDVKVSEGNSNNSKMSKSNNTANTSVDFDNTELSSSKCNKNDYVNFTFDKTFYETVNSNVSVNLACFLDGKINIHTSTYPGSSAIADIELNTKPEEQLYEATNLDIISAFPTLLTIEQFGTNTKPPIKTKKPITKNSWKWKWDSVKKYKYVNECGKMVKKIKTSFCGLRDLSELDMWTQLTMRARFERSKCAIFNDNKYNKFKIIQQLDQILSTRHIPQINLEQSDSSIIKQEIEYDEVQEIVEDNAVLNTVEVEFLFMINLKRMVNSGQSNNKNAKNNKLVLSGEWARPRCYICYECGSKLDTLKCIKEHVILRHPNVYACYYEIVGRELMEGHLYNHFYIPSHALYMNYKFASNNYLPGGTNSIVKVNKIHENLRSSSSSSLFSSSSSSNSSTSLSTTGSPRPTETSQSVTTKSKCTKCKKIFFTHFEFYRHILDCSGDYVWSQAKKKLKYRRSKRKRYNRGLARKSKTSASPNLDQSSQSSSSIKDEKNSDSVVEDNQTTDEHSTYLFEDLLGHKHNKKLLRSSISSQSENKVDETKEEDNKVAKYSGVIKDKVYMKSKAFKINSRIKLTKPRRNIITSRILRSNVRKTRKNSYLKTSLDKRTISLRKTKMKKSPETVSGKTPEIISPVSDVAIVEEIEQSEEVIVVEAKEEKKEEIPYEVIPLVHEIEQKISVSPEIEAKEIEKSPQKEIQPQFIKRKSKKINDCINMLTGKLQEKFGINFFDNAYIPLPYGTANTDIADKLSTDIQEHELVIKKLVAAPLESIKIEKPVLTKTDTEEQSQGVTVGIKTVLPNETVAKEHSTTTNSLNNLSAGQKLNQLSTETCAKSSKPQTVEAIINPQSLCLSADVTTKPQSLNICTKIEKSVLPETVKKTEQPTIIETKPETQTGSALPSPTILVLKSPEVCSKVESNLLAEIKEVQKPTKAEMKIEAPVVLEANSIPITHEKVGKRVALLSAEENIKQQSVENRTLLGATTVIRKLPDISSKSVYSSSEASVIQVSPEKISKRETPISAKENIKEHSAGTRSLAAPITVIKHSPYISSKSEKCVSSEASVIQIAKEKYARRETSKSAEVNSKQSICTATTVIRQSPYNLKNIEQPMSTEASVIQTPTELLAKQESPLTTEINVVRPTTATRSLSAATTVIRKLADVCTASDKVLTVEPMVVQKPAEPIPKRKDQRPSDRIIIRQTPYICTTSENLTCSETNNAQQLPEPCPMLAETIVIRESPDICTKNEPEGNTIQISKETYTQTESPTLAKIETQRPVLESTTKKCDEACAETNEPQVQSPQETPVEKAQPLTSELKIEEHTVIHSKIEEPTLPDTITEQESPYNYTKREKSIPPETIVIQKSTEVCKTPEESESPEVSQPKLTEPKPTEQLVKTKVLRSSQNIPENCNVIELIDIPPKVSLDAKEEKVDCVQSENTGEGTIIAKGTKDNILSLSDKKSVPIKMGDNIESEIPLKNNTSTKKSSKSSKSVSRNRSRAANKKRSPPKPKCIETHINDFYKSNKVKSTNFKLFSGENNNKIQRKSVRIQQNILIQTDRDANKDTVINSSQVNDNCSTVNSEIENEAKEGTVDMKLKEMNQLNESVINSAADIDDSKKFPRIPNKLDNDLNAENMFFNDEDSELQFKVNNDVINNFIIGESDEEETDNYDILINDNRHVSNKKTLKDVANSKNSILSNANILNDKSILSKSAKHNANVTNQFETKIFNSSSNSNSNSIKKKKHKRSILLKRSRKNNYLKLLVDNNSLKETDEDFSCALCMKSFKKIEALNRHKTTFKHITNLSKQEYLDLEGKTIVDRNNENVNEDNTKSIDFSSNEITDNSTPIMDSESNSVIDNIVNNESQEFENDVSIPANDSDAAIVPAKENDIATIPENEKVIATTISADDNGIVLNPPTENPNKDEQEKGDDNENAIVSTPVSETKNMSPVAVNNDIITMSLSNEEKFFFECCSMLKESVTRNFDSFSTTTTAATATTTTTTTTLLSTENNCDNPIIQNTTDTADTKIYGNDDFVDGKIKEVIGEFDESSNTKYASKENSMTNISDCSKNLNVRTKGALKGYDFKVSIPTMCLNLNNTLCNKNMNNNSTNDLNKCNLQMKCDKDLGLKVKKILTRNNTNIDKRIEQNSLLSVIETEYNNNIGNDSNDNVVDKSTRKPMATQNAAKQNNANTNSNTNKYTMQLKQSDAIALNNEKNDDTVLSGTSYSDRVESLSIIESSSFDDENTISSNPYNSLQSNKIGEKNNFTQNKSLIMEKIFKKKDPASYNTTNECGITTSNKSSNHVEKKDLQVNFDKLFDKLKKNDIITQARTTSAAPILSTSTPTPPPTPPPTTSSNSNNINSVNNNNNINNCNSNKNPVKVSNKKSNKKKKKNNSLASSSSSTTIPKKRNNINENNIAVNNNNHNNKNTNTNNKKNKKNNKVKNINSNNKNSKSNNKSDCEMNDIIDANNENLIEKQLQVTSSNQRKIKQVELIEAELNMSIEEIEEIIGIGRRKSKRRCASGKPKILAETWSSDEYEDFHPAHDILTLMQKNENDIMRSASCKTAKKNATINSTLQNSNSIESFEAGSSILMNKGDKKMLISRKKNSKNDSIDNSGNANSNKKPAPKKKGDRVKRMKNIAYDSDSDFELSLSKPRNKYCDQKKKNNNAAVSKTCEKETNKIDNKVYQDDADEDDEDNDNEQDEDENENEDGDDDEVDAEEDTDDRAPTVALASAAVDDDADEDDEEPDDDEDENDNNYKVSRNENSYTTRSTPTTSSSSDNQDNVEMKRKRSATEMLYYWSSSESDDEYGKTSQSSSSNCHKHEDAHFVQQHGWIVGDSHKRIVTLLAHTKGKKIDECSVVKKRK